MGGGMTWRKASQHAITNGAKSISWSVSQGCTLYALHENGEYFIFDNAKAYHEDECEVVVQATYPDAESMKSYLETGGLSNPDLCNLRAECRTAWAKLREASK